ncbi:MAG: hypothetical protein SGI87_03095 [Flavobacteriales bacterium]|nr:hypothetical protein [Flavobacteriales bacterium]
MDLRYKPESRAGDIGVHLSNYYFLQRITRKILPMPNADSGFMSRMGITSKMI